MAFIELDPTTHQPIQAAPTQQPAQTQAQTQQPQAQTSQAGFDLDRFAADSANRQMLWATQRGLRPTMQDFEDARKAAWQQGAETQRQIMLENERFQKQLQMKSAETFLPREQTSEEIEKGSGLMNAHNQIMMLYNQNSDIPGDHAYRQVQPVGEALGKVAQMTDPRVRLYEATRGGSIISLGRGLLQDTGQVAGKEQAQELIKDLMPGPGDSQLMSARKTADMLELTMNGLQARINSMPSNVDTSTLKTEYARNYADYARLVNQFGSDAQKANPAAAPDDLFGTNFGTKYKVNQALVQAGSPDLDPKLKQNLANQASGNVPGTVVPGLPGGTPQIPPGQYGIPSQFPSYPGPIGAGAQQAGQFRGGGQVQGPGMAQPDPALIAQLLKQQQPQPTLFQTVPSAIGQGAQATMGWLKGLLPENWPQGTLQQ